ncbi:hypothetical protein POM88_023657 [Heracleum sosnowskyi]|uniref:Isopenicillin N synthase-like Fe(2+) 2OG dioxygenase domain-containing protein n=1 Tax=Heracleum sosnowskyi TaxID=360622 RepID=A0AAD8MV63_9APIA|nr:hypothetical protein POM88_023657 [Heracleum sosnowskyi]
MHSEILLELSRKQREVMKNLLRGVSKSLEVDESYFYNMAEMDKGMDLFVINMYPPCPQPELATGASPHTDFGIMIMLACNGVNGLQIQQNGKWFSVNADRNHLMVNLGDQILVLDEKLQSVLGHFQKYFDGGVIVENQGAAFGGYGSFLPMHQRCPLVKSDRKTPQISQNYNRPRDEDELLNKLCPQNLELRWQTEVSSSIYATPLVADINRITVSNSVNYVGYNLPTS